MASKRLKTVIPIETKQAKVVEATLVKKEIKNLSLKEYSTYYQVCNDGESIMGLAFKKSLRPNVDEIMMTLLEITSSDIKLQAALYSSDTVLACYARIIKRYLKGE